MASELQEWVQNVRVIPYGDPAPTAPNLGEEDIYHAFEQSTGDPVMKVWDGTSFVTGVGPKPHRPAE